MSDRLVIEELADGTVRVSLRRSGQELAEPSDPVTFASPFSAAEQEDLRWYLENYLAAPFAVYEERGQAIAGRLRGWGEALFEQIFGPGKPGRDLYLQAREGTPELVLVSHSSAFLGLPWELLKDPARDTPLALAMPAFDRTVNVAGAAIPVPPGDELRVLMVIARPADLEDVGYQIVARPLLRRLEAVRGKVVLDLLRPPTLDQLTTELRAAADAGTPYHILHFDGHGTFGARAHAASGPTHLDASMATGFLAFEAADGGQDPVSAEQFALAVSEGKVPLVVLNACRSGMLGEAVVEAAVATRLLEGGAASVVAMGYSVYAVAAAEFMAEFYEALFAGKTVSAAISMGRQRLFQHRQRPSPKGPMLLEDWIVPVHYLRRRIEFKQLQRSRRPGLASLDTLLQQVRQSTDGISSDDPLAPDRRFIGRDAVFYTLERALPRQRVVVVHGPAGTGKTEVAKAFGRWWQATGGVERPEWVFFHSFEPGLATFGLDGVVSEIGLRLFGADFIANSRDVAHRSEMLLETLRERRMLLIWDNFESVRTLPEANGATPPLDAAEQARMKSFIAALAREGGKSSLLIASRTEEPWLGDIRRISLGGLTPREAVEMADDVLLPYTKARQQRRDPAFATLLAWLDGHPLSLRLLLPHLEGGSPTTLLEGLRGNTDRLPPGFIGEGRTTALGASLTYSFDHLAAQQRERTWALGLFERVVNEDVLGIFSSMENAPPRFAGVTKNTWSALLQHLTSIGLLTSLDAGMYRLHPALPAWLIAAWRAAAGAGFVAEWAAAERAFSAAYANVARRLNREIEDGSGETAFPIIDLQRHTMGRLLGKALADGRYSEAQTLIQPLDDFWDARGMRQEADAWGDRCRLVLEGPDGTPPAVDSEAGALWVFAAGAQATRAIAAGELDTGEAIYDAIRKIYEASEGIGARPQLASAYHELGLVSQERGNLAAAEQWYRKSLATHKSLNNPLGVSRCYYQLGMLAQEAGDLANAEQWYRKSLAIKEALNNRSGMALAYHQLGITVCMQGDLDRAELWAQKALEILEALGDRPAVANCYHSLGMVAQMRQDFEGAERWYRKSLEINEVLQQRPSLAKIYGQLGGLATQQGDLTAALDWTVRCVAVFEQFPHPITDPGLSNLVGFTGYLGMSALKDSWRRCTGSDLPPVVAQYVTHSLEDRQRRSS